jgi:hypothetical protein
VINTLSREWKVEVFPARPPPSVVEVHRLLALEDIPVTLLNQSDESGLRFQDLPVGKPKRDVSSNVIKKVQDALRVPAEIQKIDGGDQSHVLQGESGTMIKSCPGR